MPSAPLFLPTERAWAPGEQLFGFPRASHPARPPAGAGSAAAPWLGAEREVAESRHRCHLAGAPNDTASPGTPRAALGEPRAPLQRRPEPFKEERGAEINCLLCLPPRAPLSPSSITTTTTHAPYSPCWKVTFAINLILGHFVNQCHLHLITSVIKGIMQI